MKQSLKDSQKNPRARWFQCRTLPDIQRRANTNIPQIVPHNRNRRKIVKIPSMRLQWYLIPKPQKDTTKKETNLPHEHWCKNTDKKILANWIQEHKKIIIPEMVQHMKICQYNPPYKLKKNHMIISVNAEKAFDKNQALFHDKNLEEIRDIRNISKHNKGHWQQANSQHQIKWGETQSDSSKIRTKTRLSYLSLST